MTGTDDTEKSVLSGEVHVGIVPEHRRSASLDYHPLYVEDMYLYCGERHPFFERAQKELTPREIRSARYAGLGYQSPNMLVGQKENLTRSAEVMDQEALALFVISGSYLAFLPDHFAQQYVKQGRMRTVRPDRYRYRTEFSAIVRRMPGPPRIAQVFLDCLRQAHA